MTHTSNTQREHHEPDPKYLCLTKFSSEVREEYVQDYLDTLRLIYSNIQGLIADHYNFTYTANRALHYLKAIFDLQFCAFYLSKGPLTPQVFFDSSVDLRSKQIEGEIARTIQHGCAAMNLANKTGSEADLRSKITLLTRLGPDEQVFLYPYHSETLAGVFYARYSNGHDGWREVFEMVCANISQILDLVVEIDELKDQARHDFLSGLKNKKAFEESLARESDRAVRFGSKFVLLLLDLNKFKEVNDLLGHDIGDEVIKIVGGVLSNAVRTIDTSSRIGGDEFALILPEFNVDSIQEFTSRLNDTAKAAVREVRPSIDCCFSWGYAEFPAETNDQKALFRLADERMYKMKRGS